MKTNLKQKQNRKRAFTLLEAILVTLVIVVAYTVVGYVAKNAVSKVKTIEKNRERMMTNALFRATVEALPEFWVTSDLAEAEQTLSDEEGMALLSSVSTWVIERSDSVTGAWRDTGNTVSADPDGLTSLLRSLVEYDQILLQAGAITNRHGFYRGRKL